MLYVVPYFRKQAHKKQIIVFLIITMGMEMLLTFAIYVPLGWLERLSQHRSVPISMTELFF